MKTRLFYVLFRSCLQLGFFVLSVFLVHYAVLYLYKDMDYGRGVMVGAISMLITEIFLSLFFRVWDAFMAPPTDNLPDYE